jgi:gluconokinase
VRGGHFMKPQMLQSQFNTLEEPGNAITVDIALPIAEIIEKILLENNSPLNNTNT